MDSPSPTSPIPIPSAFTVPHNATFREVQKAYATFVFESTKGNVTRTCKRLGVGRTTFYRMMKRWGLER